MRFSSLAWTTLLSAIATVAVANDAPATVPPELTRADLEAWLDGFLPFSMAQGDIAGGVIAVVKNGEILLQKGYGYADVAAKKPVDPERTLFRAGSVGKLITHTAVMQQVEQGKLDVHADIAKYIDFPIPEGFGKPVTTYDLMTHTAGFEGRVRSLMASDPAALPSLEAVVKTTTPRRIFPPGEVPSYCNYCVAVEGYIVQRLSGESFDDYLDGHIFTPLGMKHSTFRQPLPEALAPLMSKGYAVGSGPAKYFELVGPAPAGSISTTGADMARFMIAHLQAPNGGAPELLGAETAKRMHTTMLRKTPPTLGMAMGFFERDRNGHRVLEHGGDTQFFHSSLTLFMDDGVGMFFSFNSTGKDGAVNPLRDALFTQFADRYFPAPIPNEPTTPTALEHARVVAGNYESSRRSETTFFRLFGLLGEMKVIAHEDGTIEVPALKGFNGQPKRWREVQPFVWREVDGQERLAAQMKDGRVVQIGTDLFAGVITLTPVPAWRSASWIMPTLAISMVVMLTTVIAWPINAWRRRRRGEAVALSGRELTIRRAVLGFAVLYLLFAYGWFYIVQGASDLVAYDGRLDTLFAIMNVVGFLGIVGALVALWNAALAWTANRGWKSTTWASALALSAVFLAWFGYAFNLTRFIVEY
ncbi:serine hydrolase domain-containing protein [Steroidobacter sp.]|uniref:serine hydrolase domain-containing protein n=1 Tax=Steroidobacter sp. TaxID=1978227 RepID=UPI001A48A77D|nr:serine hydrolase domain-containing protein [Steroidobacter sp.]MBL8267889.1 beta-lactamase family protein [Steroidobacter sp.]